MLYPANSRLLLGLLGTATTVSSVLPLFWHHLIVSTSFTFSNIMVIWAALTMTSMIFCIFIGPWHNLKYFPDGETLRQHISKNNRIISTNFKRTDPGFMGKYKVLNSWSRHKLFSGLFKYAKSPMFIFQFLSIILAQITCKFFRWLFSIIAMNHTLWSCHETSQLILVWTAQTI